MREFTVDEIVAHVEAFRHARHRDALVALQVLCVSHHADFAQKVAIMRVQPYRLFHFRGHDREGAHECSVIALVKGV